MTTTSTQPPAVLQYAVLVTNVDQPVYPEYLGAKPELLGAGTCGAPSVKYDEHDPVWLGERYKRLKAGAFLC